nr:lysine N(6)-hydroxylase/L-ornithine N(5)-oxygenase family protein [Nocardiopsis sp. CNR-923]
MTAAQNPADGSGAAPRVHDLVGVGLGPFNLALAALADAVPGFSARFLEARPGFSWHPGLLLEGARLQVPFLADLVTLVDPTSRWSFLSYLREHDRLFPFYFTESFHVPRREYDDYCRWAAQGLDSCRFDARVRSVRHDDGVFTVEHVDSSGAAHTVRGRAWCWASAPNPSCPRRCATWRANGCSTPPSTWTGPRVWPGRAT